MIFVMVVPLMAGLQLVSHRVGHARMRQLTVLVFVYY
jgi:hypothetical protein